MQKRKIGGVNKSVVFAVVIIIVLLAGLFFIRLTGRMIYGAATDVAACGVLGALGDTYMLTSDVSSVGACFTIGASGITLDCNGHTIDYGAGPGDDFNAVYASGVNDITIQNCIIRDTNPAGSWGAGINLAGVTNSHVLNNAITTLGTDNAHGIMAQAGASSNIFDGNDITAVGTTNSYGIYVDSSNSNTVQSGTVTADGVGSYGIYIWNSDNTLINDVTLDDPTEWLYTQAGHTTNTNNILLKNSDGSVEFLSPTAITTGYAVTKAKITIGSNAIHLSDTLSALSTGVIEITLNGLGFTSVGSRSDSNYDGAFDLCDAVTSPSCTSVSYSGGTAVFDVSGFADYKEAEACGNGVCGLGEDYINCLADCPAPAPASSGGGGNSAPYVVSVVPAGGSIIQSIEDLQIVITFSEKMLDSTINTETIILTGLNEAVVPLTVSYDAATFTVTAVPSAALDYDTQYTIKVTTGVKDSPGKSMARDYIRQFTTASRPSGAGTETGELNLVSEGALELVTETPRGSLSLISYSMNNFRGVICGLNLNNLLVDLACAASNTEAAPVSEDEFGPEGGGALPGSSTAGREKEGGLS